MNSPAVRTNPARTKTLFAILFGVPLLLAAAGAFLAFQIGRFGDLEIAVHGKCAGSNVRVRVPALVVPVAVQIARSALPDFSHKVSAEMELPPGLARDVFDVLADCPDGVFVEVRTIDEVVLVEKQGSRILVTVDTPDESVHAAVPIAAARSLLDVI